MSEVEKIWQEFYCGECQGYIRLQLNPNLNHEFWFECPNCGHQHRRVMRNGMIQENGRHQDEPSYELCPTKSAYSKEPWTKHFVEATQYSERRDSAVMTQETVRRDAFTENLLRDRWLERFGGLQNE